MIRPVQYSVREIIYHFNIESSSLPLQNFLDASKATQAIVSDLNQNLFGGQVKFELRVAPHEKGTFLGVFELIVVTGVIIGILESNIGREIVKRFTGKDTNEHLRSLFDLLERNTVNKSGIENVSDDFITEEINRVSQLSQLGKIEQSEIAIECLSKAHGAILTEDLEELKSSGITPDNFRKSFRARNDLYRGCLENGEIKGIGFDRDNSFQLGRESFEKLIIPKSSFERSQIRGSKRKPIVQIVEISVNSPNWKRDGRKWQASWSKHKEISFKIDDEIFWNKVQQREIETTTRDVLKVQWVHYSGKSKPSGDVRVIRVLKYNNKEISASLPEEEVLTMFPGEVEVVDQEPRLF